MLMPDLLEYQEIGRICINTILSAKKQFADTDNAFSIIVLDLKAIIQLSICLYIASRGGVAPLVCVCVYVCVYIYIYIYIYISTFFNFQKKVMKAVFSSLNSSF